MPTFSALFGTRGQQAKRTSAFIVLKSSGEQMQERFPIIVILSGAPSLLVASAVHSLKCSDINLLSLGDCGFVLGRPDGSLLPQSRHSKRGVPHGQRHMVHHTTCCISEECRVVLVTILIHSICTHEEHGCLQAVQSKAG